ncbi:MAG: glycosyltransferase family 39 protein [Nocardioidaceae bacterium]|nr:glycosyltransferase family 39 protein [Nocardioidaceae bacterium]
MTDRPRRALVVAIALACALRLPFVASPFGDDEGGYLYVAQHWPGPGHWLYGAQWVDRPPVLVLVFKLVALLGATPVAMRLVAMLLASVLVASAWYVGRRIAGDAGAAAAALCAAALVSNPVIYGSELISDQIGATFVAASFAVLLAALGAGGRRTACGLAALAGMLGMCAFLSKQNALLGLVMAAVVLLARPRRNLLLVIVYAVGALLPLAVTLAWAASGPGIAMLVDATYTFRVDSVNVVSAAASDAPAQRVWSFLLAALASGIVFPLLHLAWDVAGRRGQWRLRLAVVAAAATLFAVIFASLNWYAYYLLAVVPLAAVGAAVAFVPGTRRWGRLLPRLVVAVTVVAAVVAVAVRLPADTERPAVSRFVAAAARPNDSMIVLWGQPNLMEDAGLHTPYPYSWSLPVRVEDPHLTLFADTLAGRQAPTWLLEIGSIDDWGLETPRVARILAARYRVAGTVCGHRIFLRDDRTRALSAGRHAAAGAPC